MQVQNGAHAMPSGQRLTSWTINRFKHPVMHNRLGNTIQSFQGHNLQINPRHPMHGQPFLSLGITPQPAPQSGNNQQESEFLWAGYSDLQEQLCRVKKQQEAMQVHIEQLQAKLQLVQQQPAATAWQAASYLLFFLCFINFAGFVATFNVGMFMPWAVAKSSASSLWFKGLLGIALPMTNTVVMLIFCLQAVKAAWACLRW
eukprot:GHRR01003313.1.p1 GENE.GHRR01003313.1~~GHRR01003313.1.p1  ORF type:complete len:201 (+),score=50.50 GHRR01003313.1:113-715(+)